MAETNMEVAKKANKLIKSALEILSSSESATESDINRFSNIPEIFNNAAGMTNGSDAAEALLEGWMVSMANNIMFLLFRRQLLNPEIDEEYRSLPSTEEATKDYDAYMLEEQKKAEALEAQRKEFMDSQHDLDIFKAVLNGMSKDKAEEEYDKYKEQLTKSMGA